MLIREIDEATKKDLRVIAAESGHSMEEEARLAIKEHVRRKKAPSSENFAESIAGYFKPYGGLKVKIPVRRPLREPPDFSGPEFDR